MPGVQGEHILSRDKRQRLSQFKNQRVGTYEETLQSNQFLNTNQTFKKGPMRRERGSYKFSPAKTLNGSERNHPKNRD